jgi:hypothetical protein
MRKIIVSAVFILGLSNVSGIYGCSCAGWPSVCGAYAGAQAVFIGSVRRVVNQTVMMENAREVITAQRAYVQVEKTFKGTLDPEVIFRSYGSSCDPTYKEGERWLFYGYFSEKNKAWEIGACGRSTPIEGAADDLLYLEALPKSAATSRLSGTLEHYEDDPEKGFSLVRNILGAKVQIIGKDHTYETFTDRNGVYEMYGLPPGSYTVKPEIPLGLKIRFPMTYGMFPVTREDPGIKVELKEKFCAGVGFVFSSDTVITGKVIGTDGKIMPRVCLRLEPVGKQASPHSFHFSCTKDDGGFHFDEVPPGDYYLVANDDGKLSGDTPFPRVYYPGTVAREKATIVTVSAGDRITDYNIHIPAQQPTRVLSGVLMTSDGQPFPKAFVQFDLAKVEDGYEAETHTSTDAQGRFALTVLQGQKGSLKGLIYTHSGAYLNCPELERVLKLKKGDVETKPLPLEVNSDISGIQLKFPFPHCEKAKE